MDSFKSLLIWVLLIIFTFIIYSFKLFFSNESNTTLSSPKLPTNPKPHPVTSVSPDILRYKNNWVAKLQNDLVGYDSLLELVKSKNIQDICYQDLLNCFEWQFKRLKILYRDKFSCNDCKKMSYLLHVHHKFYLVNHLPWEIDDQALVSLCRDCHAKRHEIENIPIYEIINNRKVVSDTLYFRKCPRCGGTGILSQFRHVENGICFLCRGNNIEQTIFSSRINYIVQNPILYDTNSSFHESFNFFESITYEYYVNNIFNRLETIKDLEIDDDLPF